MFTSLNPDDFTGDASEAIRALELYLSLHHPYLDDLPVEKVEQLRVILTPIVRRWASITGAAGEWTAGPFKGKGATRTLEPSEVSSLRLLGGLPLPAGGLPMISAPPVEPIDDLFARRPGWVW